MANNLQKSFGAYPTATQISSTRHFVQTPSGVLYVIFVDANSDLAFSKSTNFGASWSTPTVIFTGTVTGYAVWYDRWSNISAGLIHLAYTDSGIDDTLYRTIDTENSDTLSTETTVFVGASTANGGHLSITRAVGGNVYCKTVLDAGAEGGFFRLPNANVPSGAWDAARTVDEVIATMDQMILQPDFDAADTQDILAIFWDSSADEISRKLYDDSANSWSETSISTGMVDTALANIGQHFAAAPDIANTRTVLIAWNGIDTANADLNCWTVDSGTITAKTDVVTNSTDDQGFAALSIDTETGYWYAFYGGKSDGSETYNTSVNIYMKVSTDSGSTWGSETLVSSALFSARHIFGCPRLLFSAPGNIPPVALTQTGGTGETIIYYPRPSRKLTHILYGG